MERSGVIALSVVGLLVSAVWWLAGLVLSGSDHTACGGTVSADVAFALSYVGLALGIGALAVTYRSERYEIAWALLGIYAVLLVVSLGLFLACGAQ